MEILTKERNYNLLRKGFFGNRIRTWDSVGEIIKSGYKGNISIRYKERGRFFVNNIPLPELEDKIKELINQGARKEKMIFNETPPDHILLIQGGIILANGILHLSYSTEKNKPNREVMTNPNYMRDLEAKITLRRYLDSSSYDDLMDLVETFPEHVIEFGAYETNLGNIPGRNTVIWEVRKY